MNKLEHSRLYEMMDKLAIQDMERIDRIVLWILQLGQGINYYVCLLAVFGSYFIIWQSNEGDYDEETNTTDYSQSALDMILNAVALFFMLELDDFMVSAQDYNDCREHLKSITDRYFPDTDINKKYDGTDEEEGGCCSPNCVCCSCCCPGAGDGDAMELNGPDDLQEDHTVILKSVKDLAALAPDVKQYENWTVNDVILWIRSLGKYQIYRKQIKKIFNERDINGSCLKDIERGDLAYMKFKDSMNLIRDIKDLTSNEVLDRDESALDLKPMDEEEKDEPKTKLNFKRYKTWSNDNVVDWILLLNDSLNEDYVKNRDKMIRRARKQNIDGKLLPKMTTHHLKLLGISDVDDRYAIYQEIRLKFQSNSCCLKCCVPTLNCIINVVSVIVKICCYGGGIIAPFLIFFCW